MIPEPCASPDPQNEGRPAGRFLLDRIARKPAAVVGALFGAADGLLLTLPARGPATVLATIIGMWLGALCLNGIYSGPYVRAIRARYRSISALLVLGALANAAAFSVAHFFVSMEVGCIAILGFAGTVRLVFSAFAAVAVTAVVAIPLNRVWKAMVRSDFYRTMTGAIVGAALGALVTLPLAAFAVSAANVQLALWHWAFFLLGVSYLGFSAGMVVGTYLGAVMSGAIRTMNRARCGHGTTPEVVSEGSLNRVKWGIHFPRWEAKWPAWFRLLLPRWVRIRIWKFHARLGPPQWRTQAPKPRGWWRFA